MPMIHAGPTQLDFLDQGPACLLYLDYSKLGGHLSLLVAVRRLQRLTRKPVRAYLDSADPVEHRLGCVLSLLGAYSWDSLGDHRCYEFYLPI